MTSITDTPKHAASRLSANLSPPPATRHRPLIRTSCDKNILLHSVILQKLQRFFFPKNWHTYFHFRFLGLSVFIRNVILTFTFGFQTPYVMGCPWDLWGVSPRMEWEWAGTWERAASLSCGWRPKNTQQTLSCHSKALIRHCSVNRHLAYRLSDKSKSKGLIGVFWRRTIFKVRKMCAIFSREIIIMKVL